MLITKAALLYEGCLFYVIVFHIKNSLPLASLIRIVYERILG